MGKKQYVKIVILAADIILMYLSLFLVLAVRYGDLSMFPGPQSREFLLQFSIIQVFWLALLYSFDFYNELTVKNIFLLLKNLSLFAILAFASGVVYFYLNLHSLISPKTILFFDVIIFSVCVFLRSVIFARVSGAKKFEKKIAVVGWGPEMEELARDYLPHANYSIAAVFRPNSLNGFEKLDIYTR
ncbi:MAG: hypothetical protein WCX69_06165 [Candidatus Paceibacterota bacterium]